MALDPKNPSTVWVGSGENNSQRSVSWGDGVYRSDDDGRTWRNMGLKNSEHIARVLIDPRDSNIVYVASQGPLWGPGGDRGLFKSIDGGKTWKNILTISENTGVTDLIFEPGNPDVMYAAAYQRRRHVWTLIDGGPESAIYKSTDSGATWNKLRSGLPGGDVGRIGLGISPANPNIVYAVIEAANRARRRLRIVGPRRDVGKARRLLQFQSAILRHDFCGPEKRGTHLRDGHEHHDFRRRRAHHAHAGDAQQTRGQPRGVD